MSAVFVEYRRRNPPDYGPGTSPARLLGGERIVHIGDLKARDPYERGDPNSGALVDLGGGRTSLMVASRRDDAVLGFISFHRQKVRRFRTSRSRCCRASRRRQGCSARPRLL